MLDTLAATIRLPMPHKGQRHVIQHARRFNWLSAGRRWRKTTLAMSIVVEAALGGGTYIWGAPTYDQVRIGMEECRRATGGVAHFNLSRMTAVIPQTNGVIVFRSLDNPDNVRGYTADGVVIDEAAFVKREAWIEVLRPMLIDTGGWAWGIGTPKGRNWFYSEFIKAQDHDDYMAWQIPTRGVRVTGGELVSDPHPLENPSVPFSEIVQMWQSMPERVFQQEILGVFHENTGGVFRRVMDAATATAQDGAIGGHEYTFGVDWGRSNDYTAIAVLDITHSEIVALDRFNQIDYSLQLARLTALYERFRPRAIVAEANSMGQPLIEQLQAAGLPVVPFTTTAASKQIAVDALALAFERGALRIIPDPTLIAELQAYEAERLPSGMLRYGAPSGIHDDTVMAVMLAWHNPTPATVGVTRYAQSSFSTPQRPRR
jgi:hypothetical protein